jgi:tryptophan-rich sensory protein
MKSALSFIGFVSVCLGVGAIGGISTSSSVESWYQTLSKPPWMPPDWIFAPVWSLLYFMMGTSAWIIFRKRVNYDIKVQMVLFLLQLALNLLWSILFFGFQSPSAALVDIFALWAAIFITLKSFSRISRLSGILLIPYLAWVTYASLLNFSIWRLNR